MAPKKEAIFICFNYRENFHNFVVDNLEAEKMSLIVVIWQGINQKYTGRQRFFISVVSNEHKLHGLVYKSQNQ